MTGYVTKSILCTPLTNSDGQVANKMMVLCLLVCVSVHRLLVWLKLSTSLEVAMCLLRLMLK